MIHCPIGGKSKLNSPTVCFWSDKWWDILVYIGKTKIQNPQLVCLLCVYVLLTAHWHDLSIYDIICPFMTWFVHLWHNLSVYDIICCFITLQFYGSVVVNLHSKVNQHLCLGGLVCAVSSVHLKCYPSFICTTGFDPCMDSCGESKYWVLWWVWQKYNSELC